MLPKNKTPAAATQTGRTTKLLQHPNTNQKPAENNTQPPPHQQTHMIAALHNKTAP